MQHFTYQDTTFHTTPYSTFCISITPYVWNCNIPHRTTFHIYWHHISHQITPPHRRTIPHHAMHITFKYKLHSTRTKRPHHTSHTAFQPSFRITAMSNMASNHCTSLGIRPQPHFISCITAHHHIPHRITTFHNTSSDIASQHISVASHHIAHILHRTLFHITATIIGMNKAQRSHIWYCKNSTWHQIPHGHAIHITPSDVWYGGINWTDMWDVWCAVPEMWFDWCEIL